MNNTTFKKGHIPWNKNKKGIHLSKKTEFKKGCKSIRWKPVGTITKRIDKNGTPRMWIKIENPSKWIELYRFNWLQSGRKFKKNYCIHHVDFNSLNDDIENLQLVSRSEHINIHRLGLMQ
jgi:hypothetical protein